MRNVALFTFNDAPLKIICVKISATHFSIHASPVAFYINTTFPAYQQSRNQEVYFKFLKRSVLQIPLSSA